MFNQSLTAKERELLTFSHQEERVARDAYMLFYQKYRADIFLNIANSEQRHMDAVANLLNRYSLPLTEGYGKLTDEFLKMLKKGDKSFKDALEIGIEIEILDIEDLRKMYNQTDKPDIKNVFANIGGASFMHLRAFVNSLYSNGYSTDLAWQRFLSPDELQTRGNIKYKFFENESLSDSNQIQSNVNNKNRESINSNNQNRYFDEFFNIFGFNSKREESNNFQNNKSQKGRNGNRRNRRGRG